MQQNLPMYGNYPHIGEGIGLLNLAGG